MSALNLDRRHHLYMALRTRRAEAEADGDRGGEWHFLAEHLDDALGRFAESVPARGEHAGWDAAWDSLVRDIVSTVLDVDFEDDEDDER